MEDAELHRLIGDLRLQLEVEEENYKTAVLNRFTFPLLREIRMNIKNLKGNLNILMKKEMKRKNGI